MGIAAAGNRDTVQSGKGKLLEQIAAESVCRGQREAVVGLAYNTAERIRKGNFIVGSWHEASTAVMVLFRGCGMKCKYCGAEVELGAVCEYCGSRAEKAYYNAIPADQQGPAAEKPHKAEHGRSLREIAGKTYTVKVGDNLWNIAKMVYGGGAQYYRIVR